MKQSKRLSALIITLVMMLTLTGCSLDMDFMKLGWDGVVKGEVIWENPKRNQDKIAEETKPEEETTEPEDEEETEVVTEVNEKGETVTKTVKKSSNKAAAPTSNGTATNQQSGNTAGKTNSNAGGQTAPTNNSGNSNTPAAPTTADIVNTYKTAANRIKSNTSGVTCTRTREKYIELGGNISGISAGIVKSAFSEKDDTKAKVVTGSSIKNDFIVEKQSYVCNLTEADVKSATMTKSGDNTIIVIKVKDDTDQAQNYSNKAVSATAVSDLAVPLSVGKLKYMACKDVYIEATINAAGQLINLHSYMPAYFYATDEYFAVALEQWWTISYS